VVTVTGDRGRVPFALIGVLLLVTSATLATTVDPARPPTDSESAVVVDRATATAQTELREAVTAASREAAVNPVVEPADTPAGRVLDDETPFRDALALRIYLRARERLSDIRVRQGAVSGSVSLPPVSSTEDVRAAIERVRIRRADDNGTGIRVTIQNVSVRTHRRGRVRSRTTIAPNVTVVTPVLAAHDRVSTYQERLDADVTERGLSQRLTTQLYALAWSRGYLQYGGVPISNVVSNQHVGVIANEALLDLQRRTIGHVDPRGRRTLSAAAARTTARDLTVATGTDSRVTDAVLKGPTKPTASEIEGLEPPRRSGPDEERRVAIDETADRAFVDVLDDGTIERTIQSAYAVEVRTVGRVEGDRHVTVTPPERPGENWTLVDRRRNRSHRHRNASVEAPTVPDGWHAFETYSRQTVLTERVVHVWERPVEGPNGTIETERTTTASTGTTRQNVSVAVVGRHTHTSPAPNRSIRTAHERGAGPLEGPNLASARERAIERLVEHRGGRAAVLEDAARRGPGSERHTIPLDVPANATEWAYRDLMELREQVRALSVSVEQGRAGSYQTSPPVALARELERERERLLDAPATYDSTATKARIAVRAAYLDRVRSRLATRAADRRERSGAFAQQLDAAGTSLDAVQQSLEARERPTPDQQPRLDGVGGPTRLTADSAPAYLTQAELTRANDPAIENRTHPLVARNVNVFSVPHQTVADTATDGLFGDAAGVRLDTAARTLNATNRTLAGVNDSAVFRDGRDANLTDAAARRMDRRKANVSELYRERNELRTEVASASDHVVAGQRSVLAGQGIGRDPADRDAMVDAALAPWNTTHARALALANGSVSRRLTVIANRRAGLSVTDRDRLALRLNESRRETLGEQAGRPNVDAVNATRSVTQSVVRELAREASAAGAERVTKRGAGRVMNRTFDAMPAGLPLAPVPGSWYVTTNVWHVTIRGEYARFGVRVFQGRPTTPGSEFAYARDGENVTLDVDDDGEEERLGRSTRVSFGASATVLVVVPPGKTGVGDTNGVTVEESAGWPEPGPE
jgi:hypothetical protein